MEQLGTHRECRTDYSDDRHACFQLNFVLQMHFARLFCFRESQGSAAGWLAGWQRASFSTLRDAGGNSLLSVHLWSHPFSSFPFRRTLSCGIYPVKVIKKFRIALTGNDQQGDEHEIGEESGGNKTRNGERAQSDTSLLQRSRYGFKETHTFYQIDDPQTS
jgi:hypothetical protein